MPVALFMQVCLFDPRQGYYAQGAGLGRDFTTAPEISQMFGELLGAWCAHAWRDLGSPHPVHWIELGPGRGALIADAWRAAGAAPGFPAAAQLTLVEASAPLRALQGERLAPLGARPGFAARLEDAPEGPLLLLANEFLDCLPIRQFVRVEDGWRERLVGLDAAGGLAFGLSPTPLRDDAAIPSALRQAPPGSIVETRPAADALLAHLALRLHAHPGRALFIDYGPPASERGDTLQAIALGRKVSPLDCPGAADLTARVDFSTLAHTARALGLDTAGPLPQGAFLHALGVEARAQRLAAANPAAAETIAQALQRLTAPQAMGTLFQVMCVSSPGLPAAAGFAS
jgi:NADH dehydrogenase [ubiquinone] 1 alpha subcomplex assembly factor 7